jgi:hypothetical protein
MRRDLTGLAAVLAAAAAMGVYRLYGVEPRGWVAACAAAPRPLACVPRAALLALQQHYLWGALALGLGLWAFAWRGGFAVQVAAVILGLCAVANYNATWGMLGAALGAWAWIGGVAAATRHGG